MSDWFSMVQLLLQAMIVSTLTWIIKQWMFATSVCRKSRWKLYWAKEETPWWEHVISVSLALFLFFAKLYLYLEVVKDTDLHHSSPFFHILPALLIQARFPELQSRGLRSHATLGATSPKRLCGSAGSAANRVVRLRRWFIGGENPVLAMEVGKIWLKTKGKWWLPNMNHWFGGIPPYFQTKSFWSRLKSGKHG